MTSKEVKQIIVIRRDLKMRRGKEIAQGSHSSIAWLTNKLRDGAPGGNINYEGLGWYEYKVSLSQAEQAWIEGRFTKICVRVDSEQALLEVYEKALQQGLTSHLITDAGLTEFKNEDGSPKPTHTCCAIGPGWSDEIDKVTKDLQLY